MGRSYLRNTYTNVRVGNLELEHHIIVTFGSMLAHWGIS